MSTSDSRHVRISRIAGLGSATLVYVLPIIVAGRDGVEAHTIGLMLGFVTAIILWIPSAILTIGFWGWHRFARGRVIGLHAMLILFLVPAIASLPGMVHAHRVLFGWHSYLQWHMLPSITLTPLATAILSSSSIIARNRSETRGHEISRSYVYWSLLTGSVINALFPWWPLD